MDGVDAAFVVAGLLLAATGAWWPLACVFGVRVLVPLFSD